ncbi:DEAD/DEAH box helicase [Thermocladium modestius]|nr:DEAD/DEAH box helicase [Thermocladium modestius]
MHNDMRFRASINGVEVERDWDWDTIFAVKEKLKKMGFKWNGEKWIGHVNNEEQLEKLKKLLGLSHREAESMLIEMKGGKNYLQADRECDDLNEGRNASIYCAAKAIMRRGDLIAKASNFDEYAKMVLDEVRKLSPEKPVPAYIVDMIMNSKQSFERRREWRRAEVCRGTATLNFITSALLRDLYSLKIRYNRISKDGKLMEGWFHAVERGGVSNVNGRWIIKFPIFMEEEVVDIISKHGFIMAKCEPTVRRIELPRRDVNLLGFQNNAVDAWIKNGYRGTIVIPTGGGKTFIAMKAMATLSVRTIILVTTAELMRQWMKRVETILGASVGALGNGQTEVRDVTVAIYNSAIKHIGEVEDYFDLAIFDEAHHVPAETFKEVAFRLTAPYRLALSATPDREDENQHLIYMSAGDVVFKASYDDMMAAGLVVPIRHYRIYVDMDWEERNTYQEAGDNPIVLRNIAAKAKAKIKPIVELTKAERDAGSKIIIFTQYIDQAREIYEALAMNDAELITSKARGREEAFKRFSEGRTRVLITTTVLDEGVDVPDADVAIIASGTGSPRQMIQRVGRVVRASPGKREARIYEVISKGTIEEALSEMRHDNEIHESECRKYLGTEVERLIRHVNSLRARGNIEDFLK